MTDSLSEIVCGECGILFAVPKHWHNKRRENGQEFWCPNGHSLVYRENEDDKLRRERDRLAQQIAERDDRIHSLEKEAEKSHRRTSAGVCPCCKRSFVALQRHIASKHPEFNARLRVVK